MHFLYNIGIRFYLLSIRVAALFHPKAKAWIRGRKDLLENLPDLSTKKVAWFHCASLGEFDMALPVMNRFKEEFPEYFVLVTFFSPSGMEHYHKRKHPVDLAVYLPADTPANASAFMKKIRPRFAFFVKYEFWANHLFAAKRSGAYVVSVCAVFREQHRYFKWYGGFFRKMLNQVDQFYTQNESSATLIRGIGLMNVLTIGDTRFDRVVQNSQHLEPNARIESFLNGEKAFIIGSSWPEDEAILIPFIKQQTSRKFIIAPHNVDELHVSSIEKKLDHHCCRFTDEINRGNTLILNTIGHLASAYSYGDIAYVGGGFSGSLHNILEPAVFGLPVLFGPKFGRFPEADHFIHLGIGCSIANTEQLSKAFQLFQRNLVNVSALTKKTVLENVGATERVINDLRDRFHP